jgi:hypothetical protein
MHYTRNLPWNLGPMRALHLAIALTCGLSSCGTPQGDSVGWRRESLISWKDPSHYTRLSYPVVVGATADRLNPVIQHWIGQKCSATNDPTKAYASASECLTALSADCEAAPKTTEPTEDRDCWAETTADVELDAADLLTVRMTNNAYGGGAHPVTDVADLNLQISTGKTLTLGDLLNHPDTSTLALRITHALHKERHLPEGSSLTSAGFFVDTLPVPTNVRVLPEGLLFTYESYEVAPGVEGQPEVLLPYSDIADMLPEQGAVRRVQLLLAPGNGT